MTKYKIEFQHSDSAKIYDYINLADGWVKAWNDGETNYIYYPNHRIASIECYEEEEQFPVREPGVSWDELKKRAY